jgi:hypothetical protein
MFEVVSLEVLEEFPLLGRKLLALDREPPRFEVFLLFGRQNG